MISTAAVAPGIGMFLDGILDESGFGEFPTYHPSHGPTARPVSATSRGSAAIPAAPSPFVLV